MGQPPPGSLGAPLVGEALTFLKDPFTFTLSRTKQHGPIWKTRILSLREVRANQPLGYGGTYVTKAPARIGVLPVGYADGLNRALSSRGRVIVREHYAPIVGRISMDLTLADVTGLPGIAVGDEVILLGSQDGLSVDAHEHAVLANTNVYEILCAISKRVPRKYS